MTYYIYKLEGDKCGATHLWDKRFSENYDTYNNNNMSVLETYEGEDNEDTWQIVGDIEWRYADHFGYSRGTHYRSIRISGQKGGLKGGPIAGRIAVNTGQLESLRTKEHQTMAAKLGGKIGGAIVGKIKANQIYECKCGRVIKGPSFFRHQKSCKA
tara:strand:+ start:62 stop:529 length:468 start_codon:yes stop_codon:yes gene_type:complete